jgi:phospholipase/carboxylesterase
MSDTPESDQLWLELPPISPKAPPRLLIFLHPAGSSPEAFAPVAIAWQLKFPGATGILLQGLRHLGKHTDWFDASDVDCQVGQRLQAACELILSRIAALQAQVSIGPQQTVVIGHGQGATVALECARLQPGAMSIVAAYGARLMKPIAPQERLSTVIHLMHGEFDSVVPAVYGMRAYRGLLAIGADVTLDVVEGEAHVIGQDMVNVGTTRVMQTLFRGRRARGRPTIH